MEHPEVERYQWAANVEGGQKYGNQEEIRALTKEDFDRYVKDKVVPSDFEAYIMYHDAFGGGA